MGITSANAVVQWIGLGVVLAVAYGLYPSLLEQAEIAHILQRIDRKLENHESQHDSFQALFKTMLNKLMTEEVRVKDLDIDTAEVEVA